MYGLSGIICYGIIAQFFGIHKIMLSNIKKNPEELLLGRPSILSTQEKNELKQYIIKNNTFFYHMDLSKSYIYRIRVQSAFTAFFFRS